MKKKKHIELITGYLEGSLSDRDRRELERMIQEGEIDREEFEQVKTLYHQLGLIETPEPGKSLGTRFYQMLEEEKHSQPDNWQKTVMEWIGKVRAVLRLRYLAYGTTLFLLGLIAGDLYVPITQQDEQIRQLSSQINQMREVMMISLLDESSPIERLKAVNISNDIETVDSRIAEALLKTLNNDSNVNVRLAAVDALARHADNPQVRKGLIDAISRQDSPVVQSALADAMLALQEKQSVDEFKKLLEKEELDNSVRDKLKNTIAALN